MFMVTEADAAAIRTIFEQEGELSAAIELRRRCPGIADNLEARRCARTIADWTPTPDLPPTVARLRPRKRG
jgi:RecB family exonuclease